MNLHLDSANTRTTELQTRLLDINALLIEVLGVSKWHDSAARTNLKTAIRAVNAVRADMASVCTDHLTHAEMRPPR